MIYLDNAATTFPKPECVYEAMDEVNRTLAVNAGRGSYKAARKASALIQDTKQEIRNLLSVDIDTPVVFTSSITIAINQVINGLDIREGMVVYLSPYEHNAVARSVYHLTKGKNIKVKEIPINLETLEIDLEKTKYEFSKDKPNFVFLTHVSNVTGYILPVEQVFSEAKKYAAITILDSAQSLGLLNVKAKELMADIIAFAGHKTLYGPFGIGGFINVGHIYLKVFIPGGTGSDSLNLEMPSDDESKYEAASPNVVAMAGLYAALRELDINECFEKERKLQKYLIENLRNIDGVKLYLPADLNQCIGIVSFTVEGYSSEDVGTILDEDFDIAVRTGYHCAPYIHKYLGTIKTLGTIRVGISKYTTVVEIDKLIRAIKEITNE